MDEKSSDFAPPRRSRFWRVVRWALVLGLLLLVATGAWVRHVLRGSLPRLDGSVPVAGLRAPVTIDRDALGIPTIKAQDRIDLAFAIGFAHGQDRFFQMDLLRRSAAGELAELAGGSPQVLEMDRAHRLHRFRDVARRVLADASDEERAGITAYTAGANAGLASLARQPPEYYLLGGPPRPWLPEDTVLVLFAMFLDLHERDFAVERARGLIHEKFPAELAEFLTPRGTDWDAPLDGTRIDLPHTPSADVFDLRAAPASAVPAVRVPSDPRPIPGSNNWALAGQHTAHGGAIVADDMHLRLSAPNIWYRAQFVWPNEAGGEHRVTGATLPGAPVMVVGSNGHIAWGFTNSQGDWADLVVVETDPSDSQRYLTPDGPRAFDRATETIHVRGQADVPFEITSTTWGPIIGHDAAGRPLALRWTAHDPAAVNFRMQRLEQAATLDEALAIANACGSPPQNFVVADDRGQIAWTILGRIPRRVGFDGHVPRIWSDGSCRWDGWLDPDEYPRIAAPAAGRIWTANGRVVGGDDLAKIGDGGYDLGARATQIRDRLAEMKNVRETDMLTIQLDNRALFYEPWRKLLLELLTDEAIAGHPLREQAREQLLSSWSGRADPDSVGFRIVHEFWRTAQDRALAPFLEPLRQNDASIGIFDLHGAEAIAWRLVDEQPHHLLDPQYESWNALLSAACDDVLAEATTNGATLDQFTWGGDPDNVSSIGHPLSRALPALSHWLDMPHVPLPGSRLHMPRVHMSEYGASQRMAVSPGRESEGYFHMPCGQSGHPLSPHYRDGHEAWMTGKPTPFLPGPAVHTLRLEPSK